MKTYTIVAIDDEMGLREAAEIIDSMAALDEQTLHGWTIALTCEHDEWDGATQNERFGAYAEGSTDDDSQTVYVSRDIVALIDFLRRLDDGRKEALKAADAAFVERAMGDAEGAEQPWVSP